MDFVPGRIVASWTVLNLGSDPVTFVQEVWAAWACPGTQIFSVNPWDVLHIFAQHGPEPKVRSVRPTQRQPIDDNTSVPADVSRLLLVQDILRTADSGTEKKWVCMLRKCRFWSSAGLPEHAATGWWGGYRSSSHGVTRFMIQHSDRSFGGIRAFPTSNWYGPMQFCASISCAGTGEVHPPPGLRAVYRWAVHSSATQQGTRDWKNPQQGMEDSTVSHRGI